MQGAGASEVKVFVFTLEPKQQSQSLKVPSSKDSRPLQRLKVKQDLKDTKTSSAQLMSSAVGCLLRFHMIAIFTSLFFIPE